VVDASSESNISFVKDRRPLHRRAVQHLAVAAVADFGIYRVGTNLIRDATALASGYIIGGKTVIVS
jgi:hypothetical protein